MFLLNLFRIRVQAYEKALVFRHGELVDVLDSGLHWVGPFVSIMKYDVTEMFYHQTELDLLLKCKPFAERVNVVDVADHEIAIQSKNGNFHKVLTAGRYTFWNAGVSLDHKLIDLNSVEVDQSITRKVLHRPEVMRYFTVHHVESYEKATLHVDGEMQKLLAPGVYYYWKGDRHIVISKVDMRKQQVEVSGQELLTADKASIRMSLFAHYQVVDITKALVESKDYYRQLYVTLQLGLREYVGQYTLDELLQNKESVAPYLLDYAKARVAALGVDLIDCGLKDVILPGDIKEIMNKVLLAEKQAEANTIMRREETAATRSLLNTAKLMSDNQMLFKLKEMEYMEKIAERVGEITVNGGGRVVDQLRELVGS